MYIMGDARKIEFYDIVTGSAYSSDRIVEQISLKVSDAPVYWLFNCADYVYYSHIKDSAARQGLKINIVDIKTLKRDLVYNFLLCRVSREHGSAASPVRER